MCTFLASDSRIMVCPKPGSFILTLWIKGECALKNIVHQSPGLLLAGQHFIHFQYYSGQNETSGNESVSYCHCVQLEGSDQLVMTAGKSSILNRVRHVY